MTPKKEKIITFNCSESIHIYNEKSILTPALPYKSHDSVFEAKIFLRDCKGIYNAKVIYK